MLKRLKYNFMIGCLVILICLSGNLVLAAPSNSDYAEQLQPTGEKFYAIRQGDEWFNYVATQSGDIIIKGTDGYWYYAKDQQGDLIPSSSKYMIQSAPTEILTTEDMGRVRNEKLALLTQVQNNLIPLNQINQSIQLSQAAPFLSSLAAQSIAPPTSNQKILVLLVSLSNAAIQTNEATWSNEFFDDTGKTVKTYFNEVSGGKFTFVPATESYGDDDGVVKVTLPYSNLQPDGDITNFNSQLVRDALIAADSSVNFASFDANGNHIMEYNELHIITVIAGYEAATTANIPSVWAHHSSLDSAVPQLDGVYISRYPEGGYTQVGEIQVSGGTSYRATIGVICHELGHDIGLPDLYDTLDGSSSGVGMHSLMGSGNWSSITGEKAGETPTHLDAWSKIQLGFVTPTTITSGAITIKSVLDVDSEINGYNVYKVPTANINEYFLVENRQFYGFDKGLQNYTGSSGVAIWHIDESVIAAKIASNRINGDETHKGVDLEEANEVAYGGSQLDDKNTKHLLYNNYFYSGGNILFSPSTLPNTKLYSGNNTLISMSVPSVSSTSMAVQVNYVPIGVDNTYKVVKNMTLTTTTSSSILANDTDSEGNPLTATNYSAVSPLELGSLATNPNGSFSFAANNITGTAVFTYTPNDGYADGNSATVSILVYEDTISPTIAAISANPVTPTQGSVTLTITATDADSGIAPTLGYSFDGGLNWQDSSSKVYTENVTLAAMSIRIKDFSGNISQYPSIVTISNIDHTVPTINAISLSPLTPTNGSVTLTITANDTGSGIAAVNGYSFDGGVNWQTSNVKSFTDNTTIAALTLQVKDAANNIAQYNNEVVIANIDKIAPNIVSVLSTPLTTTSGNVTVTIQANDGESGIPITGAYSFDGGGSWQDANFKEYLYNTNIVSQTIRVKDTAGNVTAYGTLISITNIDKPPVIAAGTVNRTSDTAGTIGFTTNEAGTYYYQIVVAGASVPTIDTTGTGSACTSGSNTITNPSGLVAGAMDLYIQEKDATGKLSNVIKITIAAYVAPVVVPPSGGGGIPGGVFLPPPSLPAAASVSVTINGVTQEQLATVTTEASGEQTVTTVLLDSDKIIEALKSSQGSSTMTIPIDSNASDVAVGVLDGQLAQALDNKEMTLAIQTNDAIYSLPIKELQINELARQLGATSNMSNMEVSVTIEAASAQDVQMVKSATETGKLTMVVQPISFEITCGYNGKEITVSRFANYVERMIAVPSGVNPNSITTAVVLNEDGTLSQVPTKIIKQNGKYFVVINSLTNSTYAVVSHSVTFSDMAQHWAKAIVTNMASRMIVSGYGADVFAPDKEITRAEFSSIVVKALGLRNPFILIYLNDISRSDWYYNAIKLASQYNLVGGYSDATFKPNQKITREEAFVILARVMKLVHLNVEMTDEIMSSKLKNFKDGEKISSWAQEAVAIGVQNGIVTGSNGYLYSKNNITRAETVALIMRVLQKAKLI